MSLKVLPFLKILRRLFDGATLMSEIVVLLSIESYPVVFYFPGKKLSLILNSK